MASRPARERKEPERHVPTAPEKEEEEFVVKPGPGDELGSLENVEFRLQKTTTASDELKVFHRVCFGRPGNKNNMKKNLRKFSGFPDEAATERGKKSAEKMDSKMMKKVLELCDLDKSGKKEECVDRLVGFLKAPKSSGKKSLAEKVATKRKRTEAKKEKASKKAAKKAKKPKTDGPKRPPTAFLLYCDAKRAKVREENPGAPLGQIAKILGEKWKGISEERRQKYLQQAAELKAKYEDEKAKFAASGKATKPAKKPAAKKPAAKSPAKKKKEEEPEEEADEEPEEEPEEEESEDEEPADDENEEAEGEDGDEDGKDEPDDDDDDEEEEE